MYTSDTTVGALEERNSAAKTTGRALSLQSGRQCMWTCSAPTGARGGANRRDGSVDVARSAAAKAISGAARVEASAGTSPARGPMLAGYFWAPPSEPRVFAARLSFPKHRGPDKHAAATSSLSGAMAGLLAPHSGVRRRPGHPLAAVSVAGHHRSWPSVSIKHRVVAKGHEPSSLLNRCPSFGTSYAGFVSSVSMPTWCFAACSASTG
ncbi:hypothetical protein MRX96_055873 [Rhipicephalus microplus]